MDSVHEPERAFMETIGFTEADLAANRQGYMTKKQRAWLSRERTSWRMMALITILVGFFFFILVVFDQSSKGTISGIVSQMTIVSLGAAAVLGYIGWVWRHYDADLWKGTVFTAEGNAKLDFYTNRGNTRYTVNVQNVHFDITRDVFQAFQSLGEYEPYCVIYYAPKTKTILSVEHVREPQKR